MTVAAISMVVGCLGAGEPVNQTNVGNMNWKADGTMTTAGATPTNWTSEVPSPGVGYRYYVKVTDTGLNRGSAAALTGTAISGFVDIGGGTATFFIPGGIGARNMSYQIASKSDGTGIVASGTGSVANDI